MLSKIVGTQAFTEYRGELSAIAMSSVSVTSAAGRVASIDQPTACRE